jgi:alkyl hydroperoxide reductase subunit AhpC
MGNLLKFVCPTELEDLQNHYETLKELGVEVYSASTDTHFTLSRKIYEVIKL